MLKYKITQDALAHFIATVKAEQQLERMPQQGEPDGQDTDKNGSTQHDAPQNILSGHEATDKTGARTDEIPGNSIEGHKGLVTENGKYASIAKQIILERGTSLTLAEFNKHLAAILKNADMETLFHESPDHQMPRSMKAVIIAWSLSSMAFHASIGILIATVETKGALLESSPFLSQNPFILTVLMPLLSLALFITLSIAWAFQMQRGGNIFITINSAIDETESQIINKIHTLKASLQRACAESAGDTSYSLKIHEMKSELLATIFKIPCLQALDDIDHGGGQGKKTSIFPAGTRIVSILIQPDKQKLEIHICTNNKVIAGAERYTKLHTNTRSTLDISPRTTFGAPVIINLKEELATSTLKSIRDTMQKHAISDPVMGRHADPNTSNDDASRLTKSTSGESSNPPVIEGSDKTSGNSTAQEGNLQLNEEGKTYRSPSLSGASTTEHSPSTGAPLQTDEHNSKASFVVSL